MSERNDLTVGDGQSPETGDRAKHVARREDKTEKKEFVEPVISTPTDVLEATSYFQGGTIGAGDF